MFKYIATQLEPGQEDFSFAFDDDGIKPAGGDFNYTLFVFFDSDNCWINGDVYSDCKSAIDGLVDDLYDYLNDGNYDYAEEDSFANHLDYVEEEGFNTDDNTIALLDSCIEYAVDGDYIEALVAYLEAKTGKVWDSEGFSGYSQGDYCTLVYCKEFHTDEAIKFYGNMALSCGGEFRIGILEIPDEQAAEIDFSDLYSFESLVDDWVYGYLVIDDIIWRGGDKLISELANQYGCSEEDLEVYVYENGEYINTRD